MAKLLVVFGATGNQGGSVASMVVDDSELSKIYKVRGVTRDPSNPAAEALESKGVEIVKGDIEDGESVKRVLHGAHTVFLMTTADLSQSAKQAEIDQGKHVADAAVAAGVKYLIYSSLPSPAKVSNGKLTQVFHFESKNEVENYIRGLPIASAFFAPGSFMQNYHGIMAPQREGDGSYAIANIFKPDTEIPLIDVTDTGKWVGAILADPAKCSHKVLDAATRLYTMQEVVDTMTAVSGKKVVYKQIPDDVFKNFLPEAIREPYFQMLQYLRDHGYYGSNQRELTSWAAEQARGKLTTLQEYLHKNPLQLA